jgi:glucokinase
VNVLGIDIGGTRIKGGVVDAHGKLVRESAVPTPGDLSGFRNALSELRSSLVGGNAMGGVGIGCKGILDSETSQVLALPGTLHFLEGLRLAELGGFSTNVPVRADNDARAAMAGEMAWGAAQGRRDALMLTLGTGVGGAVVANGKLLRGAGSVAGHLGHMTIDADGPLCICGNRGCLETQFSAHAIEGQAMALVHRGCRSLLTERYRHRLHELTCRAVFECAAEGDDAARLIRDTAIRRLGSGIAGLLHILDPEVVIVGGQIAEAGEALFEPLRREIRWRTECLLRRAVPLVPPGVVDKSGVIGAASLVFGASLEA